MRKNLSVLAGVAAAGLMATSAHAGFGLSAVVVDGTAGGDFQTATITLTGDALASLSAIAGAPGNPMVVSTGDGSNLFNINTIDIGVVVFDGASAYASAAGLAGFNPNAPFDSGFLPWQGATDASTSPGFNDEFASFAFAGGAPDSSTNNAVFDGDPGTPAAIGAGIQVLRLTWNRLTSISFSAQFDIVTPLAGTESFYLTIDLPAVPAPGAMALLGLAGLCGVNRRRRKA